MDYEDKSNVIEVTAPFKLHYEALEFLCSCGSLNSFIKPKPEDINIVQVMCPECKELYKIVEEKLLFKTKYKMHKLKGIKS